MDFPTSNINSLTDFAAFRYVITVLLIHLREFCFVHLTHCVSLTFRLQTGHKETKKGFKELCVLHYTVHFPITLNKTEGLYCSCVKISEE
jgi:hypothetical protein